MEVRSGAGSFSVTIDRATVKDAKIVMIGTVDDWDARIEVTPDEAWKTISLVITWKIIKLLTATFLHNGYTKLSAKYRKDDG